jgi:hypothetical protein
MPSRVTSSRNFITAHRRFVSCNQSLRFVVPFLAFSVPGFGKVGISRRRRLMPLGRSVSRHVLVIGAVAVLFALRSVSALHEAVLDDRPRHFRETESPGAKSVRRRPSYRGAGVDAVKFTDDIVAAADAPPPQAEHERRRPISLESLEFVDVTLHNTIAESSSSDAMDAEDAASGLGPTTCSRLADAFAPHELADAAPGPDRLEKSGKLSVAAERAINQREPTGVQFQKKVRVPPISADDPLSSARSPASKILCATYTHDKKHAAVVMMRAAWGSKCDRHLIFTNRADDPDLLAARIDPRDIIRLKPKGGESYDNMWQKTRAAFQYLSEQRWVAEEGFAYFFFGGDDAYLFVDNLRRLIHEPEVALLHDNGAPLFFGYRQLTRDYDKRGHARPINQFSTAFVSGAGYVMNLAAVEIAGHLVKTSRHCSPNLHASHEDVYLASCLRGAGVLSRDARNRFGEDRFIVLSPTHMMYQARDHHYSWWWRDYRDRALPSGLDIVGRDAVLYHYIDPDSLHSLEKHVFSAPSILSASNPKKKLPPSTSALPENDVLKGSAQVELGTLD